MRRLLALVLILGAGTAAADAIEAPARIAEAARAHIAAQLGDARNTANIEIGQVDPRLRLAACGASPEGFSPPGGRVVGRITVGVRCAGPQPWTLYVSATVRVMAAVVVSARPLAKGAVVTADDLKSIATDLGRQPAGVYTDPAQAIGQIVRIPVAAGTTLGRQHLAAPNRVQRGTPVTVVAGQGGIAVRSTAEALQDGAVGERIRVRNPLTKKVIYGVVTEAGWVAVGP